MDVDQFKKLPIMGILRGIPPHALEPVLQQVLASGLQTIEFAMNTEGAAEMIRKAVIQTGGNLTIGAGTVLDKKTLRAALDAGASFIVLPVIDDEVVTYCVKQDIPVFPGALCPQEIYDAWSMGATMVKVFPAKFFGPEYFKEIKGPFQDIPLMACSGVTPDNLKTYIENGADAVAVGASVFRKEWIEAKAYYQIGRLLKEYIQIYSSLRNR